MGFNFCRLGARKEITEEDLKTILPLICKAIYFSTRNSLPVPFDCKKNIFAWIELIFKELHQLGRRLTLHEFSIIARSCEWNLILFTFGCYPFGKKLGKIKQFTCFSLQQMSKFMSKFSDLEQSLTQESPQTRSRINTPTNPETPSTTPTKLTPSRYEIPPKSSPALSDNRSLPGTPSRMASSIYVSLDLDEQEPEEDDFTESDEEDYANEYREFSSKSEEIKFLKSKLKSLMDSDTKLQAKLTKLEKKKAKLSNYARQLEEENLDVDEFDDLEKSSKEMEEFLSSLTSASRKDLVNQVDCYHNFICWNFTLPKLKWTANEIPATIPGNVCKIDSFFKKGDFRKNWKNRLFVLSDKALFYYSEPISPRGQIVLRYITACSESEDPTALPNTLDLTTPERVWNISFYNRAQMTEWKRIFDGIVKVNVDRIEKKRKQEEAIAKKEEERRRQLAERQGEILKKNAVDKNIWEY